MDTSFGIAITNFRCNNFPFLITNKSQHKYQLMKDWGIGQWMILGMIIGVVIGTATDHLAMGIGMGLLIGMLIGATQSRKHDNDDGEK